MIRRMLCICLLVPHLLQAGSFLEQQRAHSRVRLAEKEKISIIDSLFKAQNLAVSKSLIFLRVFKKDGIIELWARDKGAHRYSLIRTYDICAASGDLGPKRCMGDGQVPEGVYVISGFNPVSSFYLSLRVSYPNQSDRILGTGRNLGGDIFIHGDCVTIGCMPIQDHYIKELYMICAYAKNNGQADIPVHIFPTRMDDAGMAFLAKNYPFAQLQSFWKSIRPAYLVFEEKRDLPRITIDKNGNYSVR